MIRPANIFIIYSRKDVGYKDQLCKFLLLIGVIILAIWGMNQCKNAGGIHIEPIVQRDTPVIGNHTAPSEAQAWNTALAANSIEGDDHYLNEFPPKMVFVKGGTFEMGDNFGNGESDEKPVHSVTLSDYYIGQTEVTQAQWRKVMGTSPSNHKHCDNCPVDDVSWDDAQEFIQKLNAQTGEKYRLPTEAEWEYAARGGAQSKGFKYAGSNDGDKVAVNNVKSTQVVKSKNENELGLFDMSGNVWEWCQDWKAEYPSSSQNNPTGPTNGISRVLRGGSWYLSYEFCRVSDRLSYYPYYRSGYYGFRLARDL